VTQRPPLRPAQYQAENEASAAARGDRIANRPKTLRALLRWAQHEYSLEPPSRLHDRDVADDGAPDHTGEAKSFLGFTQRTEPNDWRAVACRTDDDGFYVTPLRCAVERVPGVERRALLRAVLPNVFFPADACEVAGIPSWCADDVLFRALVLLWDGYRDRPLPRRTNKSDSQLDAEAA
jgi:hypothetical protein